ncbi:MAG: integrase [Pseudomonadota bacterium]|nr:integrase [Pseudomonadota bacterium]
MRGFLGGSAPAVAVRLLVVSFVVGLLLAMFGFDPESIYQRFAEMIQHVIEFGLTDLRHFGRILLTGAMVVVPIWFILRLMDMRRAP